MNEPTDSYKVTHNTLREAARIFAVEIASLLLAVATIPWRVVKRVKNVL